MNDKEKRLIQSVVLAVLDGREPHGLDDEEFKVFAEFLCACCNHAKKFGGAGYFDVAKLAIKKAIKAKERKEFERLIHGSETFFEGQR